VILLLLEPVIVTRHKGLWAVYLVIQIVIMVVLFLIEPDGDTFSLLLLPACMFVMRHYETRVGWAWVGIFSVFMSIMLIYGHQEFAPALIVIYFAAYILVASFSQVIKQSEIAHQKLVAANNQLRQYSEQVEDLTSINERNHLARELHDSVTQTIFSMTLITRSAVILQKRDPEQVPEKLAELQDLAQNALNEMRSLVTQLRPLSISDDGLIMVLKKHIDEQNRRNDVSITLEAQEESLKLEANQQQEVFRIIQEALNNVIKHAHAETALVSLDCYEEMLRVIISDNGRGFDTQTPVQNQFHFGLESMRQRARELGGTLEIKAAPGSGTKVICIIPIKEDPATHG
jgi:signal transduction histidine kinase